MVTVTVQEAGDSLTALDNWDFFANLDFQHLVGSLIQEPSSGLISSVASARHLHRTIQKPLIPEGSGIAKSIKARLGNQDVHRSSSVYSSLDLTRVARKKRADETVRRA
ncbi:MAG: hypothetical protein INR71_04615 [Terriglobus roseus]|nr:hypothetical protein [Terriglobus roseus]